jgi:hypothetical protein
MRKLGIILAGAGGLVASVFAGQANAAPIGGTGGFVIATSAVNLDTGNITLATATKTLLGGTGVGNNEFGTNSPTGNLGANGNAT